MELLTIAEIAGRLGTSKNFVRGLMYKGHCKRNKKVRGVPYKGFCYEDVATMIRGEAEKGKEGFTKK